MYQKTKQKAVHDTYREISPEKFSPTDDLPKLPLEYSTSNSSSCSNSNHSTLSDSFDTSYDTDPYADVRDRMEFLSHYSKMVHAYHEEVKAPNHSISIAQNDLSIPFFVAWTTYFSYALFTFVGHMRELCSRIFNRGRYVYQSNYPSDDRSKYAPLLQSFKTFYTKRIYHRIQDCFNRPICTNPGAYIHVLERISHDGNKTMKVLGTFEEANMSQDLQTLYKAGKHFSLHDNKITRNCLNLGSYNYLGFGDDWNVSCETPVLNSLEGLPVSMGSSRLECGTSTLHTKLEQIISEFLNKESAIAFNMGFNTNVTIIPALVGRGDLIISDELNHTSIINGARTSGAAIRCFRHNDIEHLEDILKESIVLGQPRTRRPWKKIMVIVEGIYSMEGEYCDLRNIVKISKTYGAYIYLDEAHSIGAMGATGRGCCEYTGVDTKDVDILMGTFTKSFGGMGGYIAADKAIIDMLRQKCASSSYHNSLSPAVCKQVITCFEVSRIVQ
jgi:serine palmitoyltransferase